MHHRFLPLKLLLAFAFLASLAGAQTTWYVDVNALPPGSGTLMSPYTSIQYAHDRPTTVDGDTLVVAPGTYVENVTLVKLIVVRSSGGAEVTTLRPASSGAVLTLAAYNGDHRGNRFEGFTITGVFGGAQGAVQAYEGQIARCIVRGNRGGNYWGVYTGYDSDIEDCTIVDNDRGVYAETLLTAIWMKNTIIWGNGVNLDMNLSPFGYDVHHCAGGPFPNYLLSPTLIPGDPGMWNLAGGDYHLRPGSPCIDSGDPALFDPDGSRSDIGYYAYDAQYAPVTTYCTGKLNSQGCVPFIAGIGLPSLTSPNGFFVTATLVPPGRRGLLLYSPGQENVPFQGGTLCVALPYRRVGTQTSQGAGPCGGSFVYDFNIRIQNAADPDLAPGHLVYAQWWHRDPFDPTGFQSGLTDGLCFGVAP